MARTPGKPPLRIETLTHDEATRRNAPTAELEAFVPPETKRPILAAYERRNPDLDPQLVWRGKDVADWSDLIVEAPPLYIQEKIHPKAIIESLRRYRSSPARGGGPAKLVEGGSSPAAPPGQAPLHHQPAADGPPPHSGEEQADLFADFNGIEPDQRTEFYAHDQHWSNRMILGDGLKVMASLAEREGMKGQVQCIYIDPPYGIKFNSNFQWSTTSRDVKDGKADHLTREPEQVKAFRDTWRDGIHSYLTYLRDRLTVARDLLTESGSVFVQISDENVHRVRALMDEVFGDDNFCGEIAFAKTTGQTDALLGSTFDYILWYAKHREIIKKRNIFEPRAPFENPTERYVCVETSLGQLVDLSIEQKLGNKPVPEGRILKLIDPTSQTGSDKSRGPFMYAGKSFKPSGSRGWSTHAAGMDRVARAGYFHVQGNGLWWKSYRDTFPFRARTTFWNDTRSNAFGDDRLYVVQTNSRVIQNCILMTTDPGDLVLDPTCGSGTTAYVAEQWGRRWITMDTSRVALALARARIMGARYPWYILADTPEGQRREGEVTRTVPADTKTHGRLRQGFVYKRVPHITLKSIANNAEIDAIWGAYQTKLEPLREAINAALGSSPARGGGPAKLVEGGSSQAAPPGQPLLHHQPAADGPPPRAGEDLQEWQIPRTAPAHWPAETHAPLAQWWAHRIARQREIDASIAAKADTEYLYDQPYEDKGRVRVAGPFTVESLSPHRVPAVDTDDTLFDELEANEGRYAPPRNGEVARSAGGAGAAGTQESADFAAMVLENLRRSGVQQPHRADRLVFSALTPWPGRFVCASGTVRQASEGARINGGGDTLADSPTRRAAILVGPEYGTVARADLTAAAREAMEAGFDLLIAAAFNFDAHASEFDRMGALTVLQARINPDLHMPDLATGGAGNLFTVFGEPDIQVHDEGDGRISIEVAGVDMYKGGQIEASSADDIAVWFVDTDYNYESFFVRHAYSPARTTPTRPSRRRSRRRSTRKPGKPSNAPAPAPSRAPRAAAWR